MAAATPIDIALILAGNSGAGIFYIPSLSIQFRDDIQESLFC